MPDSIAKSACLMLCLSLFCCIFCSRYLEDCWANLHQICQVDDKWAAIEKLSWCFLNSFWGGREVQKGHFCFGPSCTKCHLEAKWIYQRKKLSDFGRSISLPSAENYTKSVEGWWRSFGAFDRNGVRSTLDEHKLCNTEVLDSPCFTTS